MKKRIYIAGGISNIPIDEVARNFERAEAEVRRMGCEPVSPFKVYLGKKASWLDYMIICVPMLAVCEGIYLQSNWKQSKGARIEHDLAVGAEKEIYFENKEEQHG